MAEFYYITPVLTDRDGSRPDVSADASYCCTYGEMNGSPVTTAAIDPGQGRVRRTTEQEITDAMRDMGSRLPVRDPIDKWRIRGGR